MVTKNSRRKLKTPRAAIYITCLAPDFVEMTLYKDMLYADYTLYSKQLFEEKKQLRKYGN